MISNQSPGKVGKVNEKRRFVERYDYSIGRPIVDKYNREVSGLMKPDVHEGTAQTIERFCPGASLALFKDSGYNQIVAF